MYVWYLSFLLLDLYLAIFYFVFSFVFLFFYRYPLYVKHLIHFLFYYCLLDLLLIHLIKEQVYYFVLRVRFESMYVCMCFQVLFIRIAGE